MFCSILANTAILLYCIENFCCFCIKTRNTNLHKTSPPTKVKGKCTTPMYIMLHFHTKISKCGPQSWPPIQNNDILPCFLFQSFFYGVAKAQKMGHKGSGAKQKNLGMCLALIIWQVFYLFVHIHVHCTYTPSENLFVFFDRKSFSLQDFE